MLTAAVGINAGADNKGAVSSVYVENVIAMQPADYLSMAIPKRLHISIIASAVFARGWTPRLCRHCLLASRQDCRLKLLVYEGIQLFEGFFDPRLGG